MIDAPGHYYVSGDVPLGKLTAPEERIVRLIRRKPALVEVFIQLGEMLIGRRNCRTQIEVVDGVLRRYDVTPAGRSAE